MDARTRCVCECVYVPKPEADDKFDSTAGRNRRPVGARAMHHPGKAHKNRPSSVCVLGGIIQKKHVLLEEENNPGEQA